MTEPAETYEASAPAISPVGEAIIAIERVLSEFDEREIQAMLRLLTTLYSAPANAQE